MKLISLLIVPEDYLRNIWLAVAATAFVLGGHFFWAPTIEPAAPVELQSVDTAPAATQPLAGEDSLDFIFRPLFWASRRPPKSIPSETVVPEQLYDDTPVASLDGYSLVGVFASGARQGAIIATGESMLRLYVGDLLEGLTLVGTSLRAARFEGADGSSAILELAVASSLPPPRVVTDGVPGDFTDSEAVISTLGANTLAEDGSDTKNESMTFEAINQRKLREAQAAQSEQGSRE